MAANSTYWEAIIGWMGWGEGKREGRAVWGVFCPPVVSSGEIMQGLRRCAQISTAEVCHFLRRNVPFFLRSVSDSSCIAEAVNIEHGSIQGTEFFVILGQFVIFSVKNFEILGYISGFF